MTAYLDEFIPNSRQQARGVLKDAKLKFNNLLSCVAVAVLPHGGSELIGVHFSVSSTKRDNELDAAFGLMKGLLGGSSCDAYMVGPSGMHEKTSLLPKLKGIASKIYLGDVTPNRLGEAEADCKMEVAGTTVVISVRPRTDLVKGADKQPILKPQYAGLTSKALHAVMGTGRRIHQSDSDSDSKAWMRIQPVQIYPPR